MGIGGALALELARAGVNLVLNARSESHLKEVASSCQGIGIEVEGIAGNAASSHIASKLVDAAVKLGEFKGFIQAAGVLHPGPFLWELDEKQYEEILDASVTASYQLIRSAVPVLLRESGNRFAVFFGSGAAERQTPGIGAYSAAKAFEEHLARQLATETPEITTFIYRPGVVETRMQKQARSADGGAARIVRTTFQGFYDRGELISPEKAAAALVNILFNNPRRFHGHVARWTDGLREEEP